MPRVALTGGRSRRRREAIDYVRSSQAALDENNAGIISGARRSVGASITAPLSGTRRTKADVPAQRTRPVLQSARNHLGNTPFNG
jgi:hypothetical protein